MSTAFLTGACPDYAPAVFASTGYFAAHIAGTSSILCLP
ncbi:hypothetical protein D088_610021 [Salmonella enterica subsp. houtenae serovar 16:z4,z32:-- str. RKS3027]|nr:hypothetical protein D088_610021 [Salmonella enterica subsp. houtenae serovar 16:z4,z32:-- str. RKS3027]